MPEPLDVSPADFVSSLEDLLGDDEPQVDTKPVAEADEPSFAGAIPNPVPKEAPNPPSLPEPDWNRLYEDLKWVWNRERNRLSRQAQQRLGRLREFLLERRGG